MEPGHCLFYNLLVTLTRTAVTFLNHIVQQTPQVENSLGTVVLEGSCWESRINHCSNKRSELSGNTEKHKQTMEERHRSCCVYSWRVIRRASSCNCRFLRGLVWSTQELPAPSSPWSCLLSAQPAPCFLQFTKTLGNFPPFYPFPSNVFGKSYVCCYLKTEVNPRRGLVVMRVEKWRIFLYLQVIIIRRKQKYFTTLKLIW